MSQAHRATADHFLTSNLFFGGIDEVEDVVGISTSILFDFFIYNR